MEETRKCPICVAEFVPSPKLPQKKFCSRRCSAIGNGRDSSVMRTKFKAEHAIFKEAELRYGPREGRIKFIAETLGCSEPTVFNLKRRIRYKWQEEQSTKAFATTPEARKYITQYGKCAICGESRYLEAAHWWPAKAGGSGGPENIIPLCPNHHRYYDRKLLTPEETQVLETFLRAKHPKLFDNPSRDLVRKTLQKAVPVGGRSKLKKAA